MAAFKQRSGGGRTKVDAMPAQAPAASRRRTDKPPVSESWKYRLKSSYEYSCAALYGMTRSTCCT
jgi:hypothetical protein